MNQTQPDSKESPAPPQRYPARLYGATIALGAFLLFMVQPLIAKYILPWFGGSPEVWTTSMLFFQAALLAGYAYAHLLSSRLGPRGQALAHLVVLAAAVATLPLMAQLTWRPGVSLHPTLSVLTVLATSIGLPYMVLAATGPLLQGWFARTSGGAAPWRYYALSNAASLAALVSYPLVIEPNLPRQLQARGWSLAIILFALLCAACAIRLWRHRDTARPPEPAETTGKLPRGERLLWGALAATAVVVLLAVTNVVTQDIAAVPLLWVLPLCLYLLTFIVCFHGERWYPRRAMLAAFVASLAAAGWAKYAAASLSAVASIAIYCAALLTGCMVCHGELYRRRPAPARLTGYYLTIALGGALGGAFVAIIAPLAFSSYVELPLGLLGCCALVILADRGGTLVAGRRRWLYVGLLAALGVMAVVVPDRRGEPGRDVIYRARNFFGVLTIWDVDAADPRAHHLVMEHGTTFHGLQFVAPSRQAEPTAYYGRASGVGLAIAALPDRPRRIGLVGLGVGTLAAYGREGDVMRFFEIDPQVYELARERFTYLSQTPAQVDVVIGDGRLSLEHEADAPYDLLVLDAFSSGAIPVHLLTVEAFEAYLRRLADGGVLAVHVSNMHVDVAAVVARLAEHLKLRWVFLHDDGSEAAGTYPSKWILLSREGDVLSDPAIQSDAEPLETDPAGIDLWTDERTNLIQVLK